MMAADIHGILLLDKPLGLSSAGAVARAKRLFHARKAGPHRLARSARLGTACPICFGEATKFGAQLLDADKTYRVTVRLGERTPSADRESAVIERRELPRVSRASARAGAGASFRANTRKFRPCIPRSSRTASRCMNMRGRA